MSRTRRVVVTLAAALAVAGTAALGLWQVGRAAQKTLLQQAIADQAGLPAWGNADLAEGNDIRLGIHRRVNLAGRWVPDANVFLDNRQMQGRVGFFLVTPLRLSGSESVILVQRGWVPRDFNDRLRVPDVPTPDEEVRIEGRLAPPPGKLFELGEPGQGAIRQNIDLAAYTEETGLPLLPVSVLQTGESGEDLLRQWPQPAVDVQRHHGYAFQWFALSALFAGLYLWFQIIQPRRARKRPHGPDA